MLNDLPVVVDAPGMYITRCGHHVDIHKIAPNPDPLTTQFGAKGTLHRPGRRKRYEVWHVSGRHLVVGLSAWDIVAKAPDGAQLT